MKNALPKEIKGLRENKFPTLIIRGGELLASGFL